MVPAALALLPVAVGFATLSHASPEAFTDKHGWKLASKFVQPVGQPTLSLDEDTYTRVFNTDPNWIKGAGVSGVPTSPEESFKNSSTGTDTTEWSFESIDWRTLLTEKGKKYRIRQHFWRGKDRTDEYDVAFTFKYSGYVTQNDAQTPQDQTFELSDMEVCKDSTGIKWAVPNSTNAKHFWLPITPGIDKEVYTGCQGFAYNKDGCGLSSTTSRRFGTAGITPSEPGKFSDFAASWAPLLDAAEQTGRHDMLYVRNGKTDDRGVGSMYGNKGGSEGIVLMYWLCENDECRCTPTKGMDGYTVFLVLFLVGGSFYLVVGTALNKPKTRTKGSWKACPTNGFGRSCRAWPRMAVSLCSTAPGG